MLGVLPPEQPQAVVLDCCLQWATHGNLCSPAFPLGCVIASASPMLSGERNGTEIPIISNCPLGEYNDNFANPLPPRCVPGRRYLRHVMDRWSPYLVLHIIYNTGMYVATIIVINAAQVQY